MKSLLTTGILTFGLLLAAFGPMTGTVAAATAGPDHTVIVIMENRDRTEVIGNSGAPYENALAGQGVDYANAQGVTHPSLGNYLELYSGSTQGQAGKDVCVRLTANNLGKSAAAAGVSLKVYMENLGTSNPLYDNGAYACRHNPAAQFNDAANNVASFDFASKFPTDFTQLPKISFVVPNLCNDTHDCGVPTGDSWLKTHMDAYVQWAKTHNSVLLVTWDENHHSTDYTTPMPTFLVGAGVTHSVQYGKINQDHMLRTVENWYGIAPLGNSANVGAMPGLPAFTGTTTTTTSPPPTTTTTSPPPTTTTTSPPPTTTTTSTPPPTTTTTVPPTTSTTTGTATANGFSASFAISSNINTWWVETKVASANSVTKVDASVNGAWHSLAKTSWGTYAASFNAPIGSSVTFKATDVTGAAATTAPFAWMSGTKTITATGSTPTTTTAPPPTTTATTPPASGFTASFAPKAIGNDWWLESAVTANQAIAKVQVRVNGGAAIDLPKTSWGTYAKSIYAPNGSAIVFDAVSTTGQIAVSQTVTWT